MLKDQSRPLLIAEGGFALVKCERLANIARWLPPGLRLVLGCPVHVTFDSNSWQMIVRPDLFPNNPKKATFLTLHGAVKSGRIRGYIVDVLVTLEAIPKGTRGSYFAGSLPHPGIKPVLKDRLDEAQQLNFQMLHAPRIALPLPPKVEGYYLSQTTKQAGLRQKRSFAALRSIEARGIGKVEIEKIGRRIAQRLGVGGHWSKNLGQPLNNQERNEIDDAVGEWADEDALGAHKGYSNDFFCSEDFGVSAVKRFGRSIMDQNNRAWLRETLNIKIVSMEELAQLVQ